MINKDLFWVENDTEIIIFTQYSYNFFINVERVVNNGRHMKNKKINLGNKEFYLSDYELEDRIFLAY